MNNNQDAAGIMNDSLARLGGLCGRADEQRQYFRANRVYTMQIESTGACDQGCIYCYAGARPKSNGALPSRKIETLLLEARELQVRAIDWLGGDPLLRKDWHGLAAYAASIGLVNNIWTSGVHLADARVSEKVAEVTQGGFVSVHLDSISTATLGQLHRRNGMQAANKIVNGVDNLITLGKSPNSILNCITFTRLQHAQDIKQTIRWFWESRGVRTCLVLFKPAGLGSNMPDLKPPLEDIQEVFSFRNKLNYGDSAYHLGVQDVNKFYCGTMFCVTGNGAVTPCSVVREPVASIYEKSLARVVKEHGSDLIFERMHKTENLPGECRRCRNNQVCWGCRANAWYYASDLYAADPECWLRNGR